MKLFEHDISERSLENILDVVRSKEIGFGSNVSKFEEVFSSFSGKKHNVATNSASAAAFMLFHYLKESFGPCDVYTTTLGFTSPAWAAQHIGHNVIYIDITKDLQFDCHDYYLKRGMTNSVNKAVVMPVLYGGIDNISNWRLIGDEIVVVDSAHCVTPTIKADYSFFSFHPLKPICSSDGGMLSTNIEEAAEYFRKFRNFGRVAVGNTYEIQQSGFKFYMNNLNATIAIESAKEYDKKLDIRRENYEYISSKVEDIIPHTSKSSFYMGSALRDDADEIMKEMNMPRLYPLLHKQPVVSNKRILIHAERIHPKIVNFPIHHNLTNEELEFIISLL